MYRSSNVDDDDAHAYACMQANDSDMDMSSLLRECIRGMLELGGGGESS